MKVKLVFVIIMLVSTLLVGCVNKSSVECISGVIKKVSYDSYIENNLINPDMRHCTVTVVFSGVTSFTFTSEHRVKELRSEFGKYSVTEFVYILEQNIDNYVEIYYYDSLLYGHQIERIE